MQTDGGIKVVQRVVRTSKLEQRSRAINMRFGIVGVEVQRMVVAQRGCLPLAQRLPDVTQIKVYGRDIRCERAQPLQPLHRFFKVFATRRDHAEQIKRLEMSGLGVNHLQQPVFRGHPIAFYTGSGRLLQAAGGVRFHVRRPLAGWPAPVV